MLCIKGLHGDLTAMAYLTECSDKPLLAIVGGGSLEPRLKLIDGLLDLVDTLAVGGGLAATFIAAAAETTAMEAAAGSFAATGSRSVNGGNCQDNFGLELLFPVVHVDGGASTNVGVRILMAVEVSKTKIRPRGW